MIRETAPRLGDGHKRNAAVAQGRAAAGGTNMPVKSKPISMTTVIGFVLIAAIALVFVVPFLIELAWGLLASTVQ